MRLALLVLVAALALVGVQAIPGGTVVADDPCVHVEDGNPHVHPEHCVQHNPPPDNP